MDHRAVAWHSAPLFGGRAALLKVMPALDGAEHGAALLNTANFDQRWPCFGKEEV